MKFHSLVMYTELLIIDGLNYQLKQVVNKLSEKSSQEQSLINSSETLTLLGQQPHGIAGFKNKTLP